MRKLFQILEDRLSHGEDLALVTVVAASGAVPRGAGARMLVGAKGRLCGTIGGGAVEYRAQLLAQRALVEHTSQTQEFHLNQEDVQNLGMVCGGNVTVYFRYLPAGDAGLLAVARRAEALFAAGTDIWLTEELWEGGGLALSGVRPDAMDGRPRFVEQIGSASRVYIFGCGHVAQELVPALTRVGFRCVALDDRPEFAQRALFPDAEQVGLIDFEHIGETVTVTGQDYVCVMTRGHAYDTLVQAQLLKTPARYIGVIGSRRKKAAVFQRLREEFGCTQEELARITTPIGLDIRAETPAEIAISIAAQLIECRGAYREEIRDFSEKM